MAQSLEFNKSAEVDNSMAKQFMCISQLIVSKCMHSLTPQPHPTIICVPMRCDPDGVMPNEMAMKKELTAVAAGSAGGGASKSGVESEPPTPKAKAKAKAKAKQPPKAKTPEQQAKAAL